MEDHYAALEVSSTATSEEIKCAYRRLARKWHPDKNPNNREDASRRFRRISDAYDVLSKRERRHHYDAMRAMMAGQPGGGPLSGILGGLHGLLSALSGEQDNLHEMLRTAVHFGGTQEGVPVGFEAFLRVMHAAPNISTDIDAAIKAAMDRTAADMAADDEAQKMAEKALKEIAIAEQAAKEKAEAQKASKRAAEEKAAMEKAVAEKEEIGKANSDETTGPPASSDKGDDCNADRHAATHGANTEEAAAKPAGSAATGAATDASEDVSAGGPTATQRERRAAAAERRRAQEKAAKEEAEREKTPAEKMAEEKAAAENAAREKAAREKATREKAAREEAARVKAAREKAARERVAREKAAGEHVTERGPVPAEPETAGATSATSTRGDEDSAGGHAAAEAAVAAAVAAGVEAARAASEIDDLMRELIATMAAGEAEAGDASENGDLLRTLAEKKNQLYGPGEEITRRLGMDIGTALAAAAAEAGIGSQRQQFIGPTPISVVVDHYSVLEVSRTATQDQLKAAYRRLARQWHPDKNPANREEATRKFRQISESYSILSDEEKRQEFDACGAVSVD